MSSEDIRPQGPSEAQERDLPAQKLAIEEAARYSLAESTGRGSNSYRGGWLAGLASLNAYGRVHA
jgi:hypothetical protein